MPQNVRKGEELPESALKQFLQKNELLNSATSELEISQFSTGFSNLTYLLKAEDKEYVLRRPPKGAVKRGHDMGREFKVLSGLNKGFSKAPKAYIYTEETAVIGAPFYIMEKVEGIILDTKTAFKRQIPSPEFPIIANSWMNTFVELHQLDYEAVGLADLGKPAGYVARQVSNWSKQYVKAKTEDVRFSEEVMKWLADNQPTAYEHALIHNDYKYDNVVFKDATWQEVQAVLDWEMTTLGDPLMDLGMSLAYWLMDSDADFMKKTFPSPTMLPGNPGRNDIVELYTQKSGREVKNLTFYYAFGLFKLAVIIQQIYYRYHKGLTTDERFANINEATKLFFLLAWQAIQKNRIEKLL